MGNAHYSNNFLTEFHNRVDTSQIMMQANAIFEAVHAENWELVNELVLHWCSALSLFFDRLTPELKHSVGQATVHELIGVNERLIELVRRGRDSTAKQLEQFTLGRRATLAYHEDHR